MNCLLKAFLVASVIVLVDSLENDLSNRNIDLFGSLDAYKSVTANPGQSFSNIYKLFNTYLERKVGRLEDTEVIIREAQTLIELCRENPAESDGPLIAGLEQITELRRILDPQCGITDYRIMLENSVAVSHLSSDSQITLAVNDARLIHSIKCAGIWQEIYNYRVGLVDSAKRRIVESITNAIILNSSRNRYVGPKIEGSDVSSFLKEIGTVLDKKNIKALTDALILSTSIDKRELVRQSSVSKWINDSLLESCKHYMSRINDLILSVNFDAKVRRILTLPKIEEIETNSVSFATVRFYLCDQIVSLGETRLTPLIAWAIWT